MSILKAFLVTLAGFGIFAWAVISVVIFIGGILGEGPRWYIYAGLGGYFIFAAFWVYMRSNYWHD